MSYTKAFHTLSKKIPYSHPTHGILKTRSYVERKANIYAITGSTYRSGWGPKRWISLKLHSSWTWKSASPELVDASTSLILGREDAELIVVALMSAIAEYDRQEAEE
jgi:hypothetical protein